MKKNQKVDKLRWQCRRGILELDVLLDNFLNTHYAKLSNKEKKAFIDLLDYSDPLLLEWLTNQTSAPPFFQSLIAKIVPRV